MSVKKYKLPYTGEEVRGKLEKVDNIINQIIDPDNYPFETNNDETTIIAELEFGSISHSSGNLWENDEDNEGLRTINFIPVKPGVLYTMTYDESQGKMAFVFYDSSYGFLTGWNGEYNYQYLSSGGQIEVPLGATYMKAHQPSATLKSGTLEVTDGKISGTKAEFKKIYIADHGYSIYGDIIDDATMHKIVVKAEGKDGNGYNIVEIKAPSDNPEEATLALMNWGNGVKQFVDFSSMVYDPDNPTVEIVCQTRSGEPLPEFSIRYNDGQGEGRVKKLVVSPDAIPLYLTASGLKVRRNNDYNNDMNDSEYVTVNLAELADTVATLSDGGGSAKSYIVNEARRVSDIAHENSTADSFVFAALSDCHYGQNEDTQDSITNTAIALCEIKKNISLDAIALLGDFVRGDDTDTAEACNDMLVEVRKVFYDATKDVPSIWAVGNHDNAHYYTSSDTTDRTSGDAIYSYLGSNNRNTVVDGNNRQRVYGYRDFETQKIRAIYFNTADVSDNTSTSSCEVSDAQLSWLATKALDFSDKDDVTEWGVIFFSHHPLEWSSRNTEKIIAVLNDYINGAGDFAEVTERAELIAAFHGHTHNFIANSISDGAIPSIGIPQVCYGRYNEYAEDVDKQAEFGEFLADGVTPVYYTKARGSAQETSFNVIVVDRKTKKIFCTCYGAGRDREYAFTGEIPEFAPTFVTPTIENGSISLSSGSNEDDSSCIRTIDYITCEEGNTYMFVTNGWWWGLLFYDENFAFLDTGWYGGKSYKYLVNSSVKAPAGAKYMRLVCEDTSDTSNTITIHNIS